MTPNMQAFASRARRVAASVPLVFLGAAFTRTWVRTTTPLFPADALAGGLTAGNLFDATGAVSALALALLCARLERPGAQKRAAGVAALAMAASTALVALSRATGMAGLAGAAGVAGGFGFMTLSLMWAAFYMTFNPARMILYSCASQMVSDMLVFLAQGYNPPQLFCVQAALALAGCWAYRRSLGAVRPDDAPLPSTGARPVPWKPAAFLGVYALADSIAESASGTLTTYPALFLCLVPPALFLVGVAFQPRRLTLRAVYLLACVLMLLALLLPVACPGLPGAVSATFISVGYTTSKILGTLILGSLSYRLGVPGLWMLGVTRVFSYSGLFLGNWCYRAFELDGGGLSTTLCALLALCVAVASLLLFTEKGLDGGWAMAPRTDGDAGEGPEASTRAALARARELYGLTAREEEVLSLLAQGKTVPAIAADMFLAQGTVKAHVQHIYQKMGVHSRSELEARLGVR